MSWEWIEKVLQAANLPEGLVRAALRLVRKSSEVVFVFERLVCSPVALGKGLAQEYPELRPVHPCSRWHVRARIQICRSRFARSLLR